MYGMVLASLKNSARFSSNLALSVTLLKQWVHSFCQSSCVCMHSAADSDANSLFGQSTLLALCSIPVTGGLQRMCCCLRSRSPYLSVTTGVNRVYDSVAGSV